ncbi:hypothetical protein R1flu_003658 [Riccia fluitans]|uniref:Uncharacterized protein n=1 Tax=Riccia fluitans TaxID=41844 RepID=A0ABD1Y9M6_9MARC
MAVGAERPTWRTAITRTRWQEKNGSGTVNEDTEQMYAWQLGVQCGTRKTDDDKGHDQKRNVRTEDTWPAKERGQGNRPSWMLFWHSM